jgi:transglutaminase-like putative cysteine protease
MNFTSLITIQNLICSRKEGLLMRRAIETLLLSSLLMLTTIGCGRDTSEDVAEATLGDDAQEGGDSNIDEPLGEDDVAAREEQPVASRTRRFRFDYGFTLTGLKPGQKPRVWLPIPASNEAQTVQLGTQRVPVAAETHVEKKYGNRILYLEPEVTTAGDLTFDVAYDIERREVTAGKTETAADPETSKATDPAKLFLAANTNVPIDGKPLELVQGVTLHNDLVERAKQLYNIVDQHVTYKKEGTGWGRGDVLWVCDSKYGNCTDFHSLFISLTRAQGLPAKFEIGFLIPTDAKAGKIGGYHCWGWFHVAGRGWLPVDISEADKHPELKDYYFGNLTPDRVMFTVGRDIELEPKQDGPPLNFFVYPHVELDGQPLPREQIQLRFSYADSE